MIQQWQIIEETSGNPLGGQSFVPVGRGADLGTPAMTNICHNQNQFLRTMKMKLVHNLGEMDEVLYIELNEHVEISHEYRMLRNILLGFRVNDTQIIITVKNKHGRHVSLFIP
jgi:hypothetical protein